MCMILPLPQLWIVGNRPKGSWGRGSPKFQKSLGWWIMIPFGKIQHLLKLWLGSTQYMAKFITPPKEFFGKNTGISSTSTNKSCHIMLLGFPSWKPSAFQPLPFRGVGVSCNPSTWGFCLTWYCLMVQKSGDHRLIFGKYLPLIYDGLHTCWVVVWDFWNINSNVPSRIGIWWGFITIIGPGWEGLGSLRPAPVWVDPTFSEVAFCLWSSTIYISVSLKELSWKLTADVLEKMCSTQNGCNVLRKSEWIRAWEIHDPKQKAACTKPMVAECLVTGSRSANRTCVRWCLS